PFEADYDAENRLTAIRFEKSGTQIEERFEYGHDHFLRVYQRFESNIKTLEKRFVRLGLIELQERDSENNVLANNIWRPDRKGGVAGLLMRQQSQQNIYYMTNHLGHVYGVFDQAGERLSQRGYSPYGQVSGDGFTLQPFGMSTKRSDFESGLVYFGYRFYMPNLGRWLNRDPLQEQGGINLYAYVDGDPLGYVDPDGRFSVTVSYYPGGVGGGVTYGYDPKSGKQWFEGELGVGMGGKLSVDPNGNNDRDKCGPYGGVRAQWDVKIGGIGVGGKTESDGLDVSESKDNSLFDLDLATDAMGVNDLNVSVGGSVNVYGGFVF
ncbi:RHS repeat-associated core domain-containing protein, partial [Vibrio sp. 10N.286.45.A3]